MDDVVDASEAIRTLRLLALRVMIDHSQGRNEKFFIQSRFLEKYGFETEIARLICRGLCKEGLAIMRKNIWNDDGDMCGGGYSVTVEGRAYYTANTSGIAA